MEKCISSIYYISFGVSQRMDDIICLLGDTVLEERINIDETSRIALESAVSGEF